MANGMSNFLQAVIQVASFLLAAEGVVLTIIYTGVGQSSLLKRGPLTSVSAFLLILAILSGVLVLTGAMNYAANGKNYWQTLAMWSSNFTVWLFFAALLFLCVGIMIGGS